MNPEDTFPFDGYEGQKEILIDDFYGNIKLNFLLKILDGHKLRINIKGGHRYALWNKVYITSNTQVDEWYQTIMLTNPKLKDALDRRITKTIQFKKLKVKK